MLVPGAGQLYAGAWRRGALLLAGSALLVGAIGALAVTRPLEAVDGRVVAGLVAANLALLALRLFAVVDAWRPGRAVTGLTLAALAVLVTLTAVPHVAAGYVAIRGYDVLDSVFADEEPDDVLPAADGVFLARTTAPPAYAYLPQVWPHGVDPATELPAPLEIEPDTAARLDGSRRIVTGGGRSDAPWVTLLLLGSDAGPGNWGERTDTMIAVALQRGTGRAAAFGIPRNLAEVPLGGAAAKTLKTFPESLNALYSFGNTRPDLFPGGEDPGGTAIKQTVSRLLGIRIDYFALVDLKGFADLVDALGGVTIRVKERLVDEVTRAAWGEPKPTIDVQPGRTYHFFGREALAYVRSRKTSNDYTRMGRQCCFLSALARQVGVREVLRNFPRLAAIVEEGVRTDIPLRRVPDLVRLASGIDEAQTRTVTFGVEYIARRRPADRLPIPAVGKIRATVREAITLPQPELDRRDVDSVAQAC